MMTKDIKEFRKTYTDYNRYCCFEGYKLAVLYDEKDEVKRLGGRWHPDPSGAKGGFWWMPHDKLNIPIEEQGGIPVVGWLNKNKMIWGQYGTVRINERSRFDSSNPDTQNYTEYGLHDSKTNSQFKFQFWFDVDVVVRVFINAKGDMLMDYLTIEDGRKRWDELIEAGYNRVKPLDNERK